MTTNEHRACTCTKPARWGQADQAALCWACPDRKGPVCTATDGSVRANVMQATCRGGRVNTRGRVRWWGMTWVGLPKPVRFALWLAGVRDGPWVGCGCLVPLRASWARWRRSLSWG